jgi:[ribosomal protein S5]-alanine N-acetyltransferase
MQSASIPVLSSARLMLRPVSMAHHGPLLAIAQDADVTRYLHEGPEPSAEELNNRLTRAIGQWELRGYGMMVVEDASGIVGRMGVFHPAGIADPLLVYVLSRSSWGKGYATEALPLLLEWMRTTHGTEQLLAHIDPRNRGSLRVATELGAARQGTIDQAGNSLELWVFPTRR